MSSRPGHPERRCTRTRVAAHTLYENPSPYYLKEPGGTLDSSAAVFEQIDDRTVRVSGSRWLPSDSYTVKLEGVRDLGHRTVFLAGIRDPVLVATIDDFIVTDDFDGFGDPTMIHAFSGPGASIEPVNYVLELNAGTARRLNIGRKSRFTWEPAND